MTMARKTWDVVMLGGGLAGLSCANQLENLLGTEARKRVLLISAENYFVYQPFLPEVIGADIEPRHVMHPIRLALRRCAVHRAEVAKLDLPLRRVEFDPVEGLALPPVEAEHLVLALGSRTNLRAVPGMMKHGLFLKNLADALQIREHFMQRLEEARVWKGTRTPRKPCGCCIKNKSNKPVLDAQHRPVGILSHMELAEARMRLQGHHTQETKTAVSE